MSFLADHVQPIRDEVVAAEYDALFQNNGYYRTVLEAARDRSDIDRNARGLTVLTDFMLNSACAVLEHPEVAATLPREVFERTELGKQVVAYTVTMAQEAEPNLFTEYHRKHGLSAKAVDYTSFNTVSVYGTATFRDIGWLGGGVVQLLDKYPDLSLSANTVLKQSPALHRIGRVSAAHLTEWEPALGTPYLDPSALQLTRSKGTAQASLVPLATSLLPIHKGGGCPAMRLASVPNEDTQGTLFQASWNRLADVLVPPGATANPFYY